MTQIVTRPKGTKGVLSFYGGCEEFLKSRDHQIILYGGTGSGKTTAVCTKIFLLCLLYPGVKVLITRNSYVALVKSALETFERVVKEVGWDIVKKDNIPKTLFRLGESKPTAYSFPYAKRIDETGKLYEGRSRIVISSLSNAKDELGAEYDYVYLNQPELSSEDDWQFLVTRANGRRGVAPYPQLFGDPNPESERHWLKLGGYYKDDDGTLTTSNGNVYTPEQYKQEGEKFFTVDGEEIQGVRWRMIKSTYRDNPIIWNHKLNCPTEQGQKMMDNLERSLNPVMAKRLIEGEWCSFEGLVFGDVLDRSKHVKTIADYPDLDQWDKYCAVDFGFTDPFVFMWFAKNPAKEEYVCYRYIYFSNRTINEHAQTIKNFMYNEQRPKLIVADRNPESISILEQELGMNIISAKKGAGSIKAGINVVTDMLKKNELVFLEEALVEDDLHLRTIKKPVGFIEEAENYRWDIDKTGEVPIGGDDHSIDAVRYLFTFIKANQRTVHFTWV